MDFLRYPVNYRAVFAAIESNEILQCSSGKLTEHAKALCVFHTDRGGQDQTAAALLIQHLLLSKIVDRIEKSNKWTTRLVILLSFLTFIITVPPAIEATENVIRQLTKPSKSESHSTPEARTEQIVPTVIW